jgi:LPXTG-site transpeptidase (sortase) family protein
MLTGGSSSPSTAGRVRRAFVLAALASVLFGTFAAGCASDPGPPADSGFTSEVRDLARAWRQELRADSTLTVGRIVIPKIGVNVVIVEGTEAADLEQGPGHWRETPLPGQNGRMVISGHRSEFGGPFLRLDELVPGDLIEVVLPYGTAEYEVTESEIVGPGDVDHVRQRGVEELSLATCHPPGSEEFRLLIHARAVSFSAVP